VVAFIVALISLGVGYGEECSFMPDGGAHQVRGYLGKGVY